MLCYAVFSRGLIYFPPQPLFFAVEEMLTRHKDVVLIEPFINQELDYLLDNNGTDLAAVKITEKLPVPKIAGTKDEQKAGKHEDMVPKNPKNPTTKAMCTYPFKNQWVFSKL